MKSRVKHIVVFEHNNVLIGHKGENGEVFSQADLDFFENFHGDGVPYFKLIRNGIQFCEYVGAIQIGNVLIEVLPKADKRKGNSDDKRRWQQTLIDMLRVVHGFEVKAPSAAHLSLKNNSILDLYFELFVIEVEKLIKLGLVKKYRQKESNLSCLKGRLIFKEQINKNLIHKERFFTRHTSYDQQHLLHIILYKTIQVISKINQNGILAGRINALKLNFPEMPDQKISSASFDKIILNRKTNAYTKALEISQLILLHFHPNLSKGKKDVLALMFDMNLLWEKFILISLKKTSGLKVFGQNSKYFWKPIGGSRRTIRPDIRIRFNEKNYILDTKWKNVEGKPSIEDVRQMYAYHMYFEAIKVALLYPGKENYISGKFVDVKDQRVTSNLECGLMFTSRGESVREWQTKIGEQINIWINS